jgi:hypothetical protein
MKKCFRSAFVLIMVLFVSGCATLENMGIGGSGFFELAAPGSNYAIGQVVELDSLSKKVEITFDPVIPADQVAVPEGWDVSASTVKSVSGKTASQILAVLADSGNQAGSGKVLVTLSDIRTRMVPKYTVYKYLQESLKKNPDLRAMIQNYIATGTKFYVITQITSAKISFAVIGANGMEQTLDQATLKKINTRMNATFAQDDKKQYTSASMTIGFLSDAKMTGTLINEIKK